ncbi:MAG: hypothetical protein IT381_33125 [Deltaproteobacteria bacterium]|nr:hypothetical protein [Deltaproteobacteria bacterium]
MRHFGSFFLLTLCACPQTQLGVNGAAGVTGSPGPTGPQGAAGVCDATSCPPVTTIGGLAGGTVSGSTTLEAATVTGALNINRTIITRGTKKTSLNGFFCGYTAFTVDGRAYRSTATGGTADRAGPWAAKKWCEETCSGSATAHVCSTVELMLAQDLRGGSDLTGAASAEPDNPAVPMPPLDPVPADNAFDVGWVRAVDGTSSCKGFTSSSGSGTLFKPDGDHGVFDTAACTDLHPLYCCD